MQYGSKLYIFIVCQKSLDIKIMFHEDISYHKLNFGLIICIAKNHFKSDFLNFCTLRFPNIVQTNDLFNHYCVDWCFVLQQHHHDNITYTADHLLCLLCLQLIVLHPDHAPASTCTADHAPASACTADHAPASACTADHAPASTCTADHAPASACTADHAPASACTADHAPASTCTADHAPASSLCFIALYLLSVSYPYL